MTGTVDGGSMRLAQITGGGKRSVAAALAEIDRETLTPDTCALLDAAFHAARAHVIGLTGPPGVGKSTLINGLIRLWREQGLSVGVLAIDPSSQISRGALLGDRVRMRTDPDDQGVFVRSIASRGRLGGLSDVAFASVVLMRAVYDRVVVESVGVGQSEADIASVTDTVVLCVQPGSGDSMQFMKAGIMEIPDIAVVTKADSGHAATRALAELKGALGLAAPRDRDWTVPCLLVSAAREQGLDSLVIAAGRHMDWLVQSGRLEPKRRQQAGLWLRDRAGSLFGSTGLGILGSRLDLDEDARPFSQILALQCMLRISLA